MSVVGVGVDLIHVPRIARVWQRYGDKFLRKYLHPAEIQQVHQRSPVRATQYLAARWAVKESFYKALGGARTIPFPQIRVAENEYGRPYIVQEGKLKQILDEVGITSTLVSISHEKDYAIANVILQK